MFVEVIIPLALPKNYTWSVPESMRPLIQPGVRVDVGFGKNKRYAGIVKKVLPEAPASFQPKEIVQVLDEEPVLHPTQLQLWEWIAAYYLCTEGDVMQAAVPANLKLSSESIIIWNENRSLDFSDLNDREFLVAEALELRKELRMQEIQQILDSRHVYPVIKQLIDKEVCYVWEELKEKYREKKETYIRLSAKYKEESSLEQLLNEWKKGPKQMDLLLSFLHLQRTNSEITQKALLEKAGATSAQLKGLVQKGVLETIERSVNRIAALPQAFHLDFILSEKQAAALADIRNIFSDTMVCLLHGVTASGKTELYVHLIAEQIKAGKQVLYMLPEIALTAQIIRRLQQYLGGYIAIYHSKFNPQERVEIWNKVKRGEVRAVLGARSALFLPFRDLGLIIVDEEHDASYKQQDPAPRYHARDAAIYYAAQTGARVLLGSATPSLESYQNAVEKKYGLVQLQERFGQTALPVISLVDMKLVPKEEDNNTPIFSPQLADAVRQTLAQQKQVILFQNRRGYAPYLICDTCGWIPHCQQCDVTLTLHKIRHILSCHYCGNTYPVMHTCAACGSHTLRQKNFGTEKVEEAAQEIFPEARIARMDTDSIKGKHDHDTLIRQFEMQRIDILIGTQMVVKGLDFAHVSLVGIVDADGILNFTDFRVGERAYQLMEQVSGRSGRKQDQGQVIIQGRNLMSPVLGFVQNHDYESLFRFELHNRQAFGYPPFTRLIRITCKHKEKFIAEEAAHLIRNGLEKQFPGEFSGPAQPVVDRLRNQYLWELLIKLPKDSQVIHLCKTIIRQQVQLLQTNKRYRSVVVTPDVDPL